MDPVRKVVFPKFLEYWRCFVGAKLGRFSCGLSGLDRAYRLNLILERKGGSKREVCTVRVPNLVIVRLWSDFDPLEFVDLSLDPITIHSKRQKWVPWPG
jgi:hypothetical protein